MLSPPKATPCPHSGDSHRGTVDCWLFIYLRLSAAFLPTTLTRCKERNTNVEGQKLGSLTEAKVSSPVNPFT